MTSPTTPFNPFRTQAGGGVMVSQAPPNAPPGNLAASGSYLTGAMPAGLGAITVTANLTQAGSVSIQRYADKAMTEPVGAPVVGNLTANTGNVTSVNDGVPYLYFQANITNTGGGAGNLSGVSVITGPIK